MILFFINEATTGYSFNKLSFRQLRSLNSLLRPLEVIVHAGIVLQFIELCAHCAVLYRRGVPVVGSGSKKYPGSLSVNQGINLTLSSRSYQMLAQCLPHRQLVEYSL